jgi:5-dehydro-2-deoxygluconokinase
MTERALDVICLGRAAVDLYGTQTGGRLEDVQTFARYLGGSSANVAAGLARLGARSAMLTRVGNEQMGNFVREALAREGVDVSHVVTDPQRLTGLVLLGIRSQEQFPHIFFRENCADIALDAADFDASFIASSRVLAITGTHLSTEHARRTCRQAIRFAKEAGVRIVLDVDYRPVLWKLVGAGEGEQRYVASADVTAAIQPFLADCDLVVGTEEEIRIAGGQQDLDGALRRIRALTRAVIVLKRGVQGCTVFDGDIPAQASGVQVPGFPVEVLNTLGAGDAFLAGFLRGWLAGGDWNECGRMGNACGALVVSRHGCTPAMPLGAELEEFLRRASGLRRPDLDERLNYLHRAMRRSDDASDLFILAFDHRRQLEQLAIEAEIPVDRLHGFKALIAAGVESLAARMPAAGRIGIIVDDRYGRCVLDRCTGNGWWIGRPVEIPGSRPLEFESGYNVGAWLEQWPREHVVKCLVHYHPQDPVEIRLEQEERIAALHAECVRLDRQLLLEVICHGQGQGPGTIAEIMRRFYNLGVYPDWWKIEPPAPEAWPRIIEVIEERDPQCSGVLLLGLDVPIAELEKGFDAAARVPLCRGFAIGRSIFGAAARPWLTGEIDDAAAIRLIADNYRRVISLWNKARRATGAAA